jgi:hypothetical protein
MWSADRSPYAIVVKAIVESGLVTWIGLLVYEISSLAPAGHVTSNYDIGYVMLCIIPIFFVRGFTLLLCKHVGLTLRQQGISQCLIIVRLGFAREPRSVAAHTNTSKLGSYKSAVASTRSAGTSSTGITLVYPVPVKLSHDVEMDSLPGSNGLEKELNQGLHGPAPY